MKTPNASDELLFNDYFDIEDEKDKAVVSMTKLIALREDFNWLLGYCESMEWALKFYKDKYENKD